MLVIHRKRHQLRGDQVGVCEAGAASVPSRGPPRGGDASALPVALPLLASAPATLGAKEEGEAHAHLICSVAAFSTPEETLGAPLSRCYDIKVISPPMPVRKPLKSTSGHSKGPGTARGPQP